MTAPGMAPPSRTIRLGGHEWTIRPLTLAQLEELDPVVQSGPSTGPTTYGAAVIAAGLRRDHPEDAALADRRELEATGPEVAAASSTILRLGGYLPETAPGEARAAESAAGSTSASSTDASPPAAATPPA
ncbi:hypothetical protein [Methylobacterium terricola]|uniref:hypothetical protein n=1 Tax=Methylobacterium terricola TaxID=2583531 RepID=UPI00197BFDAC|nr:hypothetical protein [Methylobacterium terricola]